MRIRRIRPLADETEHQRIQTERNSNKDTRENIYTTEKIYTDNRENREKKDNGEKRTKERKIIFDNGFTQHPPFSTFPTLYTYIFSVKHRIYFNLWDVAGGVFAKTFYKRKKKQIQTGLWGWS